MKSDPKSLKVRIAATTLVVFAVLALGAQFLMGGEAVSTAGALLLGTRTAVWLALLTSGIALPFGLVVGSVAGWRGRRTDALLARGVELTGTLPVLVVAGIVTTWSADGALLRLAVCLGVLRGVELARIVRGEVRRVAATDFIVAARALGVSSYRTLTRHVLPHCLRPVAVSAALTAAYAIGVEAALSFVGLRPPGTWVSWGSLLHPSSAEHSGAAPYSALSVVLLTWALYVLSEAAAESVDPRRPDRQLARAGG